MAIISLNFLFFCFVLQRPLVQQHEGATEVPRSKLDKRLLEYSATWFGRLSSATRKRRIHTPHYIATQAQGPRRVFLPLWQFESGRIAFVEHRPQVDQDKTGVRHRPLLQGELFVLVLESDRHHWRSNVLDYLV